MYDHDHDDNEKQTANYLSFSSSFASWSISIFFLSPLRSRDYLSLSSLFPSTPKRFQKDGSCLALVLLLLPFLYSNLAYTPYMTSTPSHLTFNPLDVW